MAQATDPQKMSCPICRKVTTLPDGDLTTLPTNFFMDNLKELITKETDGDEDEMKVTASADREVMICSLEDCQGKAVIYCTFCKSYLCDTCTEEHAAGRFTKTHETIPALETKGKGTSNKSQHPCGRHRNQILDMYCKTCDEIICHECFNTMHSDHHITSLRPFVKPCEERLDTLLKTIDKLLKCVDLARQTSKQQVDKAQHHIASLKTQVTSTFTQIRMKLAQQEESLIADLEVAATRLDKVASSTQDEQQLAEVNLESLRFLGQSLLAGDVYDQMSNLPSLEKAVEKRWKTEIPGVVWIDEDVSKIKMSGVDNLTLTETSHTSSVLPCLHGDNGSDNLPRLEEGAGNDRIPLPDKAAVNVTGGASNHGNIDDQDTSESGDDGKTTSFSVGGRVCGVCVYNDTVLLVKLDHAEVYFYSARGDLLNVEWDKGDTWIGLGEIKRQR